MKSKLSFLFCVVTVLALLGPAPALAAAKVTISMEVGRTRLALGETLSLGVRITGDRKAVPALANLQGFVARRTGTSSQFNLGAGGATSSVLYSYALTPKKEGTFVIGPASVDVGGKIYTSNTIRIMVDKSRDTSGPNPNLFLESRLTPKTGYPGQELTYRLSFFHSAQVGDASLTRLPQVPGITLRQLGDTASFATNINGIRYEVEQITWGLTADEPGEYVLPAPKLQAKVAVQSPPGRGMPQGSLDERFFGFTRTRTRLAEVTGDSVSVTILPFPEKGRPADFGGLVGDFSMTAQLSPQEVRAGDSATLTLTIRGRGNARLIPDPQFPRIDGLKTYADQPVFEIQEQPQGTFGVKTMKWALVPQKEGQVSIPAFDLPYFDPESASFRVAGTREMTLDVQPGDPKAAPLTPGTRPRAGKEEVALLAQDILPIHESSGALSPALWRNPVRPLALLFIPLAVLLVSLLGRVALARTPERVRAMGVKKAFSVLSRQAKSIGENDAAVLARLVSAFLVTRLELGGGSPTAEETREMLEKRGVDPHSAEEFCEHYSRLEALVFSPSGSEGLFPLRDSILKSARTIDKKIKKKP